MLRMDAESRRALDTSRARCLSSVHRDGMAARVSYFICPCCITKLWLKLDIRAEPFERDRSTSACRGRRASRRNIDP